MKKILFAFSKQAFAITLGSMLVLESVFPLAAFAQENPEAPAAPAESVSETVADQALSEDAPTTESSDPAQPTENDEAKSETPDSPSNDGEGAVENDPATDDTSASDDAALGTEQAGIGETAGTETDGSEAPAEALEMQSFGASMNTAGKNYSSISARNDSANTTKDTPVVVDVLANDSGNGIYIWKIHSAPSNGTAVIENGKIKYTPKAGFVGEDKFTYKIMDKYGKYASAEVCIKVIAPKNNPPQATDDSASTEESTPVSIDVLANDSDPDGDTITITNVGTPANGTASIDAGKVLYTPNGGYTGGDSFTYEIKDSHGAADTATVTVTVTKKPDTTPNKATVIATKIVCENESDLPNWGLGGPDITEAKINEFLASHPSCKTEAGWQFQWAPTTASDPGNDLVGEAGSPWTTFPNVTDSNGQTTVEIDLTNVGEKLKIREVLKDGYIPFTYHQSTNPSNADAVSAEMYCHNDVLNYDNYDFILGHEKGKTYRCVAFNVEKDTPPPPVTNTCPLPKTLGDDTKDTIGSSSNSSEKELADVLDDAGYNLDVSDDQKQIQTWDVAGSNEVSVTVDFIDEIAGNTQVFGFYKNGDLSSFKPLFRVGAVPGYESVPNASVGSTYSTTTGLVDEVGFAIKTYNGSSVVTVATENSLNSGGKDQVIAFNPSSNEYVLAFEDVIGGDYDFNDVVVSTELSCKSVTKNNPPVATDDSATTPENTSVLIDVLVNDSDPDGDTLTITATTTPSNGTIVHEGNEIRYTPNNDFVGTDTFEYTISDGNGGTDTALVTVTVTGGGTGGSKKATIIATKIVCDAESDLPNWGFGGDDITESRINTFLAAHPDCRVVSGWQFQWAPANAADPGRDFVGEAGNPWTTFPNATDANGEASVEIDVSNVGDKVWVREVLKDGYIPFTYDGSNRSNDDAVSAEMYCHTDVLNYDNYDFVSAPKKDKTYRCVAFNVEKDNGNGGNNPPIATDDSATTPENTSVLIDILANDSDPDGDAIEVISTTTPSNGSIVHEGNEIRYTPNTDYTGTDTFEYTIKDTHGATDTAIVTITITDGGTGGGNNPPIANDDATTTPKNISVLINVLANDSDPDSDTITIDGAPSTPSNGTAVIEGGEIRYTPNTDFVGTDTFNYGVSDGNGGTDSATVTVVVTDGNGGGGNNPPVASDDSVSTPKNTSVLINILANDIDPDGDTLTITATTTPSNGTIVHEGNEIRYTPNNDFVGTDTFEYTISDGKGGTDTAVVTINVTDDNGGGGGDDDDDDDNGGGGGGGRRRTPRDGTGGTPDDPIIIIDQPLVLGASTGPSCPTGDYLTTYMRRGQANDPQEVRKLQTFLRNHLGLYASLPITGVYDEATENAVSQFQTQYASDVLAPWGISAPTGYAYIYTIQKINDIMCGSVLGESKEGGFIKEGGPVSGSTNGNGNPIVGLIGATSTATSTGFMDNVAAALEGAAGGMSLYLLLILILLVVGTILVIRGIMLMNYPEEYKKMRDNLINGSTALLVATVLNIINTLTLMSDLERGQLRTGFGYKGLLFLDTANILALILIGIFYAVYAYQRRKRNVVAHG